jgi:PadR family transcriptional regulator PadR
MKNGQPDRVELLQGTLDMLALRTLLMGPAHGHEIAKHIQRITNDGLQVEHGHRREFKYYKPTPAGRKQLLAEESKWKKLTAAIASTMWSLEEG